MESKKTTKNDAADIKATVKDILNADKTETVKKAAAPAKKAAAPAKKAENTEKTAAAATTTTAAKKTTTTAAKKTTTTAAKKTTTTAAKAPAKKAAAKDSATKVVVQIWGNDMNVADITAKAEEAYKKGGKKKAIKELYIKPEEGKAYYVADDDSGSVDLW